MKSKGQPTGGSKKQGGSSSSMGGGMKKTPKPATYARPGASSTTPVTFSRTQSPSATLVTWDRAALADDPIVADLDRVETGLQILAEKIGLDDHYQAVNDLDQGIAELAPRIAALRDRGYVYKAFLENKAGVLESKWAEAEAAVRREIRSAETELVPLYEDAVRRFNQLHQGRPSAAGVSAVEREIAQVESRVSQAESTLRSAYSNIKSTFYQTNKQLEDLEWMYEELGEASFDLFPGEGMVQATRGEYQPNGGDEQDGILYATDQRLVFERKEQVATKKVLFIATEKEMMQEVTYEARMQGLDSVKATRKGMMGGQQILEAVFTGEATLPVFNCKIKGQTSDEWANLLNRVNSGQIMSEKVAAEGEDATAAAEEAFTSAPERCSSCGAPVPELTATQRQHECEYCGTVMRW